MVRGAVAGGACLSASRPDGAGLAQPDGIGGLLAGLAAAVQVAELAAGGPGPDDGKMPRRQKCRRFGRQLPKLYNRQ